MLENIRLSLSLPFSFWHLLYKYYVFNLLRRAVLFVYLRFNIRSLQRLSVSFLFHFPCLIFSLKPVCIQREDASRTAPSRTVSKQFIVIVLTSSSNKSSVTQLSIVYFIRRGSFKNVYRERVLVVSHNVAKSSPLPREIPNVFIATWYVCVYVPTTSGPLTCLRGNGSPYKLTFFTNLRLSIAWYLQTS